MKWLTAVPVQAFGQPGIGLDREPGDRCDAAAATTSGKIRPGGGFRTATDCPGLSCSLLLTSTLSAETAPPDAATPAPDEAPGFAAVITAMPARIPGQEATASTGRA
jgi:hypothetical protein